MPLHPISQTDSLLLNNIKFKLSHAVFRLFLTLKEKGLQRNYFYETTF